MTPQQEQELRELADNLETILEAHGGTLLLAMSFPQAEQQDPDEITYSVINKMYGQKLLMVDSLSTLLTASPDFRGVLVDSFGKFVDKSTKEMIIKGKGNG